MSEIKITVSGSTATVDIHEVSIKETLNLYFTFDSTWNNCDKKVCHVIQKDRILSYVINDNKAKVKRSDLVRGLCWVSIRGYSDLTPVGLTVSGDTITADTEGTQFTIYEHLVYKITDENLISRTLEVSTETLTSDSDFDSDNIKNVYNKINIATSEMGSFFITSNYSMKSIFDLDGVGAYRYADTEDDKFYIGD